MVDHALNCLQFFRNESCGQCVPCRIGSQKLVEIAHTLCDDQLDRDTWKDQVIPLVQELSSTMRETSICGLGEVAANPLISLMEYFEQDIDHHLK
jgi:NADH:ubiquinone oxidoreductase subunit F (NADH-binding)